MKSDLRKKIVWWFCGYAAAALILIYYFHAPVVPVLLAGALTLALTLFRHFRSK